MASQDRPTASHIVNDLIQHSHSYSFFQAVRLLEDYYHLLKTDGGRAELKQTLIQFSVNPALDYHVSDLDSIEITETEELVKAKLQVNFMGLYGAATPMPVFYTETIIQAEEGIDQSKDFMDLFNHRMISLVYKCWEKYRYYLNYRKGNTDQFSNWMFSLMGMYKANDRLDIRNDDDFQWHKLLPFLSMLGMRCHSVSIIESILKSYFDWQNISIKSNIKRYVSIAEDQQNRLGLQNAVLGNDMLLGTKIEDRNGKFRVVISNLPYHMFCQFLPDGEYYQSLRKLINFILRDQLDYDIELQLLNPEIPILCLEQNSHEKLGLTTWIGESSKSDKTVLLPGR